MVERVYVAAMVLLLLSLYGCCFHSNISWCSLRKPKAARVRYKDPPHTGRWWRASCDWSWFTLWEYSVVPMVGCLSPTNASERFCADRSSPFAKERLNCIGQMDVPCSFNCIVACAMGPWRHSKSLDCHWGRNHPVYCKRMGQKEHLFTLFQNTFLLPTPISVVCCPGINYPFLLC